MSHPDQKRYQVLPGNRSQVAVPRHHDLIELLQDVVQNVRLLVSRDVLERLGQVAQHPPDYRLDLRRLPLDLTFMKLVEDRLHQSYVNLTRVLDRKPMIALLRGLRPARQSECAAYHLHQEVQVIELQKHLLRETPRTLQVKIMVNALREAYYHVRVFLLLAPPQPIAQMVAVLHLA